LLDLPAILIEPNFVVRRFASVLDTPFPLKEYRKGYNYERREEKMNESEPKIAISKPR
jgi:hypothetical protein